MKGKRVQRLPSQIVVSQCFRRIERMRLGVVLRVHVISHNPLRQRSGRVDRRRSSRNRNLRCAVRLRDDRHSQSSQQADPNPQTYNHE